MENSSLKISVQTGGIFRATTNDRDFLEEKFKLISESGFEAVDYNIDHFVNLKNNDYFWNKEIDELIEYFSVTKGAADKYNVGFSQAHAVFPFYVEGDDELSDYLIMSIEKNMAICEYLGCPMIVVHSYCSNDESEKDFDLNLSLYKKLIPAAKKYGVKICLENGFRVWENRGLDGGMCSDADEALKYINALNEAAGEDVFGFCLDTGHANVLKKDIKAFIKKLGKHLLCLHIHDNYEIFDAHLFPFTQICPGFGKSVDWDRFVEGLKDIGYRGDLSFECFRAVHLLPDELKSDGLKFLSAIGRYFRNKIKG